MRSLLLALLAIAAALAFPALEARGDGDGAGAAGLVVHEWGTFTSVAGADGVALEWRPLAGKSDLPSFVYEIGGAPRGLRHGALCSICGHAGCRCQPDAAHCSPERDRGCGCKSCMIVEVRMETPVLYFYADLETTVSVKVDFPQGRVTEWYPQARAVGTGIDWGAVKVLPGAKDVAFPVEPGESHYYPARKTDAAPVRVCSAGMGDGRPQHEKFLFYRGAGTFDLPIAATIEGETVRVRNLGKDEVSQVVLFENRGGRIGYRIHGDLGRGGASEVVLARPEPGPGIEPLERDLEKILTTQGLYGAEAKAMIETWRGDWFEEGLRVFYILPRRRTDEVLPIAIEPAPKDLVRVFVGRFELITPDREAAIRKEVGRLSDPSPAVRAEAEAAIRRQGRFAEPVLRRAIAEQPDALARAPIEALLDGGAE